MFRPGCWVWWWFLRWDQAWHGDGNNNFVRFFRAVDWDCICWDSWCLRRGRSVEGPYWIFWAAPDFSGRVTDVCSVVLCHEKECVGRC
jgi:hypothetical protein